MKFNEIICSASLPPLRRLFVCMTVFMHECTVIFSLLMLVVSLCEGSIVRLAAII